MSIHNEKIASIYGHAYFNCLISKHKHIWCMVRRGIGLFLDKLDRKAAEAGVDLALQYAWYLGLVDMVSKASKEAMRE